ncbi:MAG: asparagine synthase (glutamine-hydrolyzing) [Pseudomonadota bacterium]
MCGIAGIHSLGAALAADTRPRVEHMVHLLEHRGPDGSGFWSDSRTALGHARLSIIDLAGGEQPIRNEDGSIWITFNGEIFNYLELRAELEQAGHQFYTKTDTEVLVHAYEEFGDRFLERLNGQFAFGLWDVRQQRLLLARDRVGIAPLYYRRTAAELQFSSTQRPLAAIADRAPAVNRNGLHQLTTFWTTLAPETLLEGVYELPPGHWLCADRTGIETGSYWHWRFPHADGLRDDAPGQLATELTDLLDDATRLRLRSDVPVGAYLSGGLDSSTIAALLKAQGADCALFSLAFERAGYDESEFQQTVVRDLGLSGSTVTVAEADIAKLLPETIRHTETPLVRTGPVPLGALSALARSRDYKVVLTGEGADEVLGGYDIFKEAKVRSFVDLAPESERRPKILQSLYPYLDFAGQQNAAFLRQFFGSQLKSDSAVLGQLFASHATRWNAGRHTQQFFSEATLSAGKTSCYEQLAEQLPEGFEGWHPFCRAQYLEARLLLPGYILSAQGDRMLMRSSVEGRFPFLDHRLIEFANELHPRCKMPALHEKALLKKAFRTQLPPQVVRRKKQPYRASGSHLKDNPGMQVLTRELLNPDALRATGLFDESRVGRLMGKLSRIGELSFRDESTFITVLTTQLWHRDLVDNWPRYRYRPQAFFKDGIRP